MYRTTEERLAAMEKKIEMQAFHIKLLQKLVLDSDKYQLFQIIISTNMNEDTFHKLRVLTRQFEQKLQLHESITLSQYIQAFSAVLNNDGIAISKVELAEIIPKWLYSPKGNFGYSKILHEHFYQ
ncbi:hypothetical protein [Lysinibacillus sp. 54212]|uniref:hypothetical protein n=1 Tax=Lysinibacillus sp. 54212 TaxID=3119829 RepID=UPI002FCBC7D4